MEKYESYHDYYTFKDKLKRLFWNVCCMVLFRPFILPQMKSWRLMVLRMFGAKIGEKSNVYASAKIWAPWNLEIGDYTCVGPHSELYNPGKIVLGDKVDISQYAMLCTATHDYEDPLHPLQFFTIKVENHAWVAINAFVGPGVHIGEYAVVGANACVYKDVEPYAVMGGNPAKFIKKRVMKK